MFSVQQSYGVGMESSILKKRVHINCCEIVKLWSYVTFVKGN